MATLAIKLAVNPSLLASPYVHGDVGILISNILYSKRTLHGELPVIPQSSGSW